MELTNTFAVKAPITQVWSTLMDVEQVTGCVPGASVLNQLADNAYQVGMKVRVGPVTMQYRGQVEIVERDELRRRAVLRGKAKEARGQGTADATVTLSLDEADGETRGSVHADVALSGRAAAMGQGVIGDVADQLVSQFAGNLETLLSSAAVPARSGATVTEGVETAAAGTRHGGVERPPEQAEPHGAPVEQTGGDGAMVNGQVLAGPGAPGGPAVGGPEVPPAESPVSGGAQDAPGARASDRVAAGEERPSAPRPSAFEEEGAGASLDGLALAGAIVRGRLTDPRVVAGLLVAVALLAFRLGRRSRRATTTGTYRVEDLELLARILDRAT